MQPTLTGPPELVALAGASSYELPHSIEAFRLGQRLGASGVQSDVWVSSDGIAVLDAEGLSGSRFRRKRIAETTSADLDTRIVTLSALLGELNPTTTLMLSVRDPSAYPAIDSALSGWDTPERSRVWILSSDLAQLGIWREHDTGFRFAHYTRISGLRRGLEPHAAELRRLGVDGLSVSFEELTAGHVAMLHRFTRSVIATGTEHERQMSEVLSMGVDVLISRQVERMVDVATQLDIRGR